MGTRVGVLSISENNLTGPIPPSLFQAAYRTLQLEQNNFYGPIPSGFYYFAPDTISLGGNNAPPPYLSIKTLSCNNIIFLGISPTWADASGGATFTLEGENFLPVDGFECLFGLSSSPATVLTPESMSCDMPAVVPGTVEVAIAFAGTKVSVETLTILAFPTCEAGYFRLADEFECRICPGEGGSEGGGKLIGIGAGGMGLAKQGFVFSFRVSELYAKEDQLSPIRKVDGTSRLGTADGCRVDRSGRISVGGATRHAPTDAHCCCVTDGRE
ncbi:hypothetical protein BDK51DRAFT_36455 [Blyttiomyces helicus]|uniref:IPT/TIG domain-containing protein n=1 Tax=Blyttiomyces helicus TaxID=388810 RepID=A0A4P9WEN3_9FUNG|nr:hypothetical protein BDK51DRAFT_36455 [Blyttiomyces helicus]|eukprot:RKO89450.1 hypothetical protein BDK51DRAFT_36455 [Blyttiomyces helicus]